MMKFEVPNDKVLTFNEESSIIFLVNNGQREMLKLCSNGDIFVKGKLVENDKEVIEALREWLKMQGVIK